MPKQYLSRGFPCDVKECQRLASEEIENQRNGDVVGKFCQPCNDHMISLLNTGVDEQTAWQRVNEAVIREQTFTDGEAIGGVNPQ